MENKIEGADIRKRQKIRSANKTVYVWIIIASVVIGICAVVAQFFIREALFKGKIYSALEQTNKTLRKNISAYDGIKSEVTKLLADSNLALLKKGEDSTTLQVVIDALPTEENRPALALSMQTEILEPAGVNVESFSVLNDSGSSATGLSVSSGGVDTMASEFSFSVSGDYNQIAQMIKNMERSIRPMTIKSISMQSSGPSFRVSVTAVTYYQPSAKTDLKERTIEP